MAETKGWANPWTRHYQSVWLERTANPNLPAWLRISFLAFGSHKANGHARFAPGDIAHMLGRLDEETGELRTPDKRQVQREIRRAIEYGYLALGSGSLCLIVPAHAIEGGEGNRTAECPLHARRKERARTLRVVS